MEIPTYYHDQPQNFEPIEVLGYVRESTEGQMENGHRSTTQKKDIKRYSSRNNFDIPVGSWYEDAGSGGGVKDRPCFLRMIERAKNDPAIKFIVVYDFSRFFRNVEECFAYCKELETCGVIVLDTRIDTSPRAYLTHGISTEQWAQRLHAWVDAEKERRRITDRVTEGYVDKAMAGMYLGPLAFGLKWLDEETLYIGYDGKNSELVKDIFELYSTGLFGFSGIAKVLNDRGLLREVVKKETVSHGTRNSTKRKIVYRKFTFDMIRSILSNKSYVAKQNANPFKQLRTLDADSLEVDLKPLIPEELFNAVQTMIANKANKPTEKPTKKNTYLLSGLLYSGVNGAKMHAQADKGTRRYMVSTNKQQTDEHIPSIRADAVEAPILELLSKVEINAFDKIEKMLVTSLKTQAQYTAKPSLSSYVLRKQEERVRTLKELLKEHYTVELEKAVREDEAELTRLKSGRDSSHPERTVMKYYSFAEIRAQLLDLVTTFQGLQSDLAKKELLDILFDRLYSASFSIDNIGTKGILISEEDFILSNQVKATERLALLLKKFAPLLFEKIYVTQEAGVLDFRIVPTGLFLLLADQDVEHYTSSANLLAKQGDPPPPDAKKKTFPSFVTSV